MKKTIKTVALIAVLGLGAAGCQKEQETVLPDPSAEQTTIYTVSYVVDGVVQETTLYGEQAWTDFLLGMFALAREGHFVCINGDNVNATAAKETVVHTTQSEEDALNWSKQKIREGYVVNISYNPRTGVYTCTAVR